MVAIFFFPLRNCLRQVDSSSVMVEMWHLSSNNWTDYDFLRHQNKYCDSFPNHSCKFLFSYTMLSVWSSSLKVTKKQQEIVWERSKTFQLISFKIIDVFYRVLVARLRICQKTNKNTLLPSQNHQTCTSEVQCFYEKSQHRNNWLIHHNAYEVCWDLCLQLEISSSIIFFCWIPEYDSWMMLHMTISNDITVSNNTDHEKTRSGTYLSSRIRRLSQFSALLVPRRCTTGPSLHNCPV